MRVLVSISWCASHRKGGDLPDAPHVPGAEHAAWLAGCVDLWVAQLRRLNLWPPHRAGCEVCVAATDFHGLLNVPAGEERDTLWKLVGRGVPVLGHPDNPGHQVGAALAIRLGVEYAGKCGFDTLVHTAEDVVPRPHALKALLDALRGGADYVGEPWGMRELNAQFFAVRPEALAPRWDPCRTPEYGCVEGYLFEALGGKHLFRSGQLCGLYRHTHDHAEWDRWAGEEG